jgi:hypothetical protein
MPSIFRPPICLGIIPSAALAVKLYPFESPHAIIELLISKEPT